MPTFNPNQFNAYANYQPQQMPAQQFTPMQNVASSFVQAPSGLSIAQVNSEEQVNSYPVAAGNTVLLIDFAHQTFYLKSTNMNGVPMPVQTADWKYRQTAPVQTIQNEPNSVTRQEFDELKGMLAQVLSNQQNFRQNRNKRGGDPNAQSGNDAAANG